MTPPFFIETLQSPDGSNVTVTVTMKVDGMWKDVLTINGKDGRKLEVKKLIGGKGKMEVWG